MDSSNAWVSDPDYSHDPDEFNGFGLFDISATVISRRRLSTLSAVEVLSSFSPDLASTLIASVFERVLPDTPLGTDGDSLLAEVSGPGWNETPAGNSSPSSHPSIHDPVPRCELVLGNQQATYYVLSRGTTQNANDFIIEMPAGYKFVKETNRLNFF